MRIGKTHRVASRSPRLYQFMDLLSRTLGPNREPVRDGGEVIATSARPIVSGAKMDQAMSCTERCYVLGNAFQVLTMESAASNVAGRRMWYG